MLARLSKYFQLPGVWNIPPGIVPDNSSLFGALAGLNNVNAYCGHLEVIASTGTNNTITATQCRRRVLRFTSGASGGFTITLPTTSAILDALGSTLRADNTYGQMFSILNDGVGQTATLTAGDASTTITGTATIATNTRRDFFLMITAPLAITYFNIGSAAI
jgi:hypothetical protein